MQTALLLQVIQFRIVQASHANETPLNLFPGGHEVQLVAVPVQVRQALEQLKQLEPDKYVPFMQAVQMFGVS